jgi:hypothetical protein
VIIIMDNYLFVTVASNDPTAAGGTPSAFTNTFANAIPLPGASWEVALFSLAWYPPTGTEIVLVNASVVEQTVVVGSQSTQTLRRILCDTGGQPSEWESPPQMQFVPASIGGLLERIEVSMTDENGTVVLAAPNSVSFITLAFRQKLRVGY